MISFERQSLLVSIWTFLLTDRNDRWCLPAWTVSFGPTCGFQRDDMRHFLQFLKGGNPKAPFQKGMTSLEHFIMQGHILLLKGDTLRGRLWERRMVRHRGRYTYNHIQSWNILKLRVFSGQDLWVLRLLNTTSSLWNSLCKNTASLFQQEKQKGSLAAAEKEEEVSIFDHICTCWGCQAGASRPTSLWR